MHPYHGDWRIGILCAVPYQNRSSSFSATGDSLLPSFETSLFASTLPSPRSSSNQVSIRFFTRPRRRDKATNAHQRIREDPEAPGTELATTAATRLYFTTSCTPASPAAPLQACRLQTSSPSAAYTHTLKHTAYPRVSYDRKLLQLHVLRGRSHISRSIYDPSSGLKGREAESRTVEQQDADAASAGELVDDMRFEAGGGEAVEVDDGEIIEVAESAIA
ncbi:hypothetical protein P152DRAFT_445681 [Eremomyces bilateralis CBS 781.70]|uniref:Uncharacterized protein n=1 Tax=Eremomyces bilateralis CBS 781.70 TaxID=1392243 RepID=A0A6G1GIA5_9PEZI|nr:uncharacterized protein P152DRAFT_445681 [Eremomyces bilateralis CBS 781.70]KAF1817631.1 hypothetical protein P152DRAFT_445681 [Eremomyces bilateralis CBS 781.70]